MAQTSRNVGGETGWRVQGSHYPTWGAMTIAAVRLPRQVQESMDPPAFTAEGPQRYLPALRRCMSG